MCEVILNNAIFMGQRLIYLCDRYCYFSRIDVHFMCPMFALKLAGYVYKLKTTATSTTPFGIQVKVWATYKRDENIIILYRERRKPSDCQVLFVLLFLLEERPAAASAILSPGSKMVLKGRHLLWVVNQAHDAAARALSEKILLLMLCRRPWTSHDLLRFNVDKKDD